MEYEDDGVPLSVNESAEFLKEADTKKKGIVLHPEDIIDGALIAIYSIKQNPQELSPIMGLPLQVKATNLPYIIAISLADPERGPLVLDTRFLSFMRVTKDYAAAMSSPAPTKRRGGPQA